jgi:hypothetical protein
MSDREMLEFAAKAAGIDLQETEDGFEADFDDSRVWNPLADDGDALRLMVSIGIRDYFGLEVQKHCVQATCFEPWEHCEYEEYKNQDPLAATRRAIVRAAAEIGRQMP